jgi:hypothetical protein
LVGPQLRAGTHFRGLAVDLEPSVRNETQDLESSLGEYGFIAVRKPLCRFTERGCGEETAAVFATEAHEVERGLPHEHVHIFGREGRESVRHFAFDRLGDRLIATAVGGSEAELENELLERCLGGTVVAVRGIYMVACGIVGVARLFE